MRLYDIQTRLSQEGASDEEIAAAIAWQRRINDAHTAVQKALQRGELVEPLFCAQCGKMPWRTRYPHERPLHAHHADYFKPLDVEWLCAGCHHGLHRELRDNEQLVGREERSALGSVLRETRHSVGMAQVELATRAGISQGRVSQAERGGAQSHATVEAICGALGLSADDLASRTAKLVEANGRQ